MAGRDISLPLFGSNAITKKETWKNQGGPATGFRAGNKKPAFSLQWLSKPRNRHALSIVFRYFIVALLLKSRLVLYRLAIKEIRTRFFKGCSFSRAHFKNGTVVLFQSANGIQRDGMVV